MLKRRIGIALIGIGVAVLLLGSSLRLAAWRGQIEAKHSWESGAGESAPVENGMSMHRKEAPAQSPDAARHSHSTLARAGAPIRLSFPALGEEFFVSEGATTATLLRGPAHLAWSGPPGEDGNCVIVGHRDTHFRVLRNVSRGQEIDVEQYGRMFRYRIVEVAVVESKDDRFYRPTRDPMLTLVTCFPFSYFGRAPQRFIVRAELLRSGSSM
jgi:sortase A